MGLQWKSRPRIARLDLRPVHRPKPLGMKPPKAPPRLRSETTGEKSRAITRCWADFHSTEPSTTAPAWCNLDDSVPQAPKALFLTTFRVVDTSQLAAPAFPRNL